MLQKTHLIILISVISLILSYTFISCSSKTKKEDKSIISSEESIKTEDSASEQTYDELKEDISNIRILFNKSYAAERSQLKKDSIIQVARLYLISKFDDMFKAWYATPWTFEGHTKVPREGSIACGYFVTTTLQDMGFKIPRYYWAQQTADYMTYKLSKNIKRFYKVPMSEIVDHIQENGEGLYIVGLDCHVGYIYYYKKKMSFVHSNYYKKSIGVMSEPLIGRNPLNDSKLKVLGKILDDEMVANWILGNNYEK